MIMDIGHNFLDKRVGTARGIDTADQASEQTLDPGVAGLWKTYDEDIVSLMIVDGRQTGGLLGEAHSRAGQGMAKAMEHAARGL
ncbi:MAG TPA: hypothetical protein VMJ12_05740 [Candidatus Acidoferrales bacterium]|nr:hypothetical protein [Candidatus Acidoferrales bacterium]